MTIKTTADGDSVTTETIADRLRSIQGEPWRKMRYVDENDEAAWDAYNDSLFLKPTQAEGDTAPPAAGADEKPPVLEDVVPVLRTPWGETEYLESIFGKKPVPPPKPVPTPAKVKEEPKVKEAPVPPKPEAEEAPRPRATRTRGGSSAAGTARRGTRGKAGGA
jgi:DNA-directed RNA polymerase-3 subunit RPC5